MKAGLKGGCYGTAAVGRIYRARRYRWKRKLEGYTMPYLIISLFSSIDTSFGLALSHCRYIVLRIFFSTSLAQRLYEMSQ